MFLVTFCILRCLQYNPFLDGIQSPLVSSKVQDCLEESWPLILQATALDAVPVKFEINGVPNSNLENLSKISFISGHSMVRLELCEYQFLWGMAMLVLFHAQQPVMASNLKVPLLRRKDNQNDLTKYEIWLHVVQSLSKEAFFCKEFLTLDLCQELLQVTNLP